MPFSGIVNPPVGRNALFNLVYDQPNDKWIPLTATSTGVQQVTTAGSGTTGTDRSATVGTTAAQLFPAAAGRTRLIIKNDGANNIWINLGGTAATTIGGGNYKIAANGGFFELAGYSGAVSAIAETAAVNVSAREF